MSRRILLAWLALLILMLASLASAYVPLGPWNLVTGVAIAFLKALIVLTVFMGLLHAPALLRIIAVLGSAMLALLFTLSSVDYATREQEAKPMQQPQQLTPALPEALSK
jgi:cytochrome c oxidase subunit 4